MKSAGLAVTIALFALAPATALAQAPQDACALLTARPLHPVGGALVPALVTFRWEGPNLADPRIPLDLGARFVVLVSRDGGEFEPIAETVETAVTRFLQPGMVRWVVLAAAPGCPIQRPTMPGVFRIQARTDCPNEAPVTLSPAPGSTVDGASVTLTWSTVPGADAYRVVLGRFPDSQIRTPPTRQTAMTLELPAGLFRWSAVALTSGCDPAPAQPAGFRVERCEMKRPVLLTPPEGGSGLTSPVTFAWSSVPEATSYRVWSRQTAGALDTPPLILGQTTDTHLQAAVPDGAQVWWVEALGEEGCSAASSARALSVRALVGCPEPRVPRPIAPVSGASGAPFILVWMPIPGASSYEVEQSVDEAFGSPMPFPPQSLNFMRLELPVDVPTTRWFRVRSVIGCSGAKSPFSAPVAVTITPELATIDAAAAQEVTGTVRLCLVDGALRQCAPGRNGDNEEAVTVTLAPDQTWLTIEPSTVTFPANGSATVRATADGAALPVGTNRAGLRVTGTAAKTPSSITPSGSVTVTLTLVTPVAPLPAAAPGPSTLILPAVAHAPGAFQSTWESDVRLLNAAPTPMRYRLTYTPSGTNGTLTGKTTELEASPGEAVALDDVLETWFAEQAAIGTLEIRALETEQSSEQGALSFASSRTFNISGNGTFGQFVPAIPFAQFIGFDAPVPIALQQLADNEAFRTNVGLTEGAGEPAEVALSFIAPSGTLLATHSVLLQPREHRQLDRLLSSTLGIMADDFRIEAAVTSPGGRVTVYASRVDNRTGDPIVAYPEQPNAETEAWVVPGVAAINTGAANWRTDLRIHNPASKEVTATLTFYPQGSPQTPVSEQITLAAGEMTAINDVLPSLWGIASGGGAIHVTTEDDVSLVVTGETYNLTEDGTYGLFLRGVPRSEGVGAGGRTLQLLQIEQSERFRTNLGLAEVTGSPVKVEISAVVPESRVTPILSIDLKANEFLQILEIIKALNLPSTYNGRIAVRAVGGAGKVTAYAAVVDNITGDPTYVPSQ